MIELFILSLCLLGITVSYSVAVSGGGLSMDKTINRTSDHGNTYGPITLPVGTAGTLSTRTDDDTGVITAAGHSLSVSDVVDVYWSGGVRYRMVVSSVSGDDVTVGTDAGHVGAGDVLPAEDTAVVITEQVLINTTIDGDEIAILAVVAEYTSASSTAKAHVDFQDSGDATIEELDLSANEPQVFDITGGATNVFTGNPITHCQASNGSATEEATLKIICGEDSTP